MGDSAEGTGGGGGGGVPGDTLDPTLIATTILQNQSPELFEQMWTRVKRGVVDGTLGHVAKFPARRRSTTDGLVILVYTRSFEDVDDVWVYDALCDINAQPVGWKADIVVIHTRTSTHKRTITPRRTLACTQNHAVVPGQPSR